jgi:hypothetical protein
MPNIFDLLQQFNASHTKSAADNCLSHLDAGTSPAVTGQRAAENSADVQAQVPTSVDAAAGQVAKEGEGDRAFDDLKGSKTGINVPSTTPAPTDPLDYEKRSNAQLVDDLNGMLAELTVAGRGQTRAIEKSAGTEQVTLTRDEHTTLLKSAEALDELMGAVMGGALAAEVNAEAVAPKADMIKAAAAEIATLRDNGTHLGAAVANFVYGLNKQAADPTGLTSAPEAGGGLPPGVTEEDLMAAMAAQQGGQGEQGGPVDQSAAGQGPGEGGDEAQLDQLVEALMQAGVTEEDLMAALAQMQQEGGAPAAPVAPEAALAEVPPTA